jgi:rfaE bifunctional protein nucleotidyltransferase chain/domain
MEKNLDSLLRDIESGKIKRKDLVLCHGVFDLVHYGHLKYFESAKKFGKHLVVSLTTDKFIKKGPNRPIFNQNIRLNFLRRIDLIDYVLLSDEDSAVEIIKLLKPRFYVKGPDYKNNKDDKTKKIIKEKNAIEKVKGKIIYTKDPQFSSSSIINNYGLALNNEQIKFLKKIQKKFSFEKILKEINKLKKIKVSLFGELIFDEYFFGDVIGKSGKEPHLVFSEKFSEVYIGGIGAVGRHIASFVDKILLYSNFSDKIELNHLIKKKMEKNIRCIFIKPEKNYKSILKKRYIDIKSNYKIFGSYILPKNNKILWKSNYQNLTKKINKKGDLAIIADYGHGFIDKKIFQLIKKNYKYISLNAQINSSNVNTHSLKNYNNFDLLVINETEIRSDYQDNISEIIDLGKKVLNEKKIKNLVITRGLNGAIMLDKHKIYKCPAFAYKSIDKVGAGDAMLSIISLCLKENIDKELSLFLGSLAGAFSVENIGNSKPLSKSDLERNLEYIMK